MPDGPKLHPPTWAVALAALVFPLVIAFVFLLVFGLANQPMSAAEYRSDPQMGQKLADRNNLLLILHAVAQLGFVVLGAWRITTRTGVRVLFLLIAIPVSAFVFFGSLVGLIAK